MQMQPPVKPTRCGGGAAIFPVADQRGSKRRAMGAQLMGASGHRHERQPRHEGRRVGQDGIAGYRPPRPLSLPGGTHFFPRCAALLGKRQVDLPPARLGHAGGQAPIKLTGAPGPETLG